MAKICTQFEIEGMLFQHRKLKIVFTNGCFDILHVGHVKYLQAARQMGELLFVGVNSDASVKRLKGKDRPVQCEEDRCEILSALSCVDFVCIFDEDTPIELIKKVKPNILVKGGDWPVDKIIGADFVKKSGGQVSAIPFVEGRSTSSIIKKILG